MASLRVYGQRKPLVVNKRTDFAEAGNGTLQAALRLGWTHIAVVYVDDDPAAAAGFSLSDNRTAELAEWDKGALDELLREAQTDDLDLKEMLTKLGDDELHVSGDGGLENTDIKPETVRPAPSMAWVLVGVPLPVWGAAQEHVAALQKLAEQHQGLSVQSNRD